MKQARIFLGNALEVRVFVETWDEGDQAFVPYVGPDVYLWFSAELDGDAIDPALDLVMVPTSEPGVYVSTIIRDLIDLHFTPLLGQAAYQNVEAGPDGELTFVTTYLVTNPRYAAT